MVGCRKGLVVAACCVLVGCVRPADERADRDFDEVGRATSSGVSAHVDPGNVLSFASGVLVVRANAPTARIDITGTSHQIYLLESIFSSLICNYLESSGQTQPNNLIHFWRTEDCSSKQCQNHFRQSV
jgi:hypothetical protein